MPAIPLSTAVALVDDDVSVLRSMARLLETAGYKVFTFSSPIDFLNRAEGLEAACLVLDVTMPEMTGLEIQEKVSRRMARLPIIFLSGTAHPQDSEQALRQGALAFLAKPVSAQDFLAAVSAAVKRHQAVGEGRELEC
jgi:two-component system, LuxR family, response regulator FixJ